MKQCEGIISGVRNCRTYSQSRFLRTVLLQDVAVLMGSVGEHHPFFKHDLFQSDEFKVRLRRRVHLFIFDEIFQTRLLQSIATEAVPIETHGARYPRVSCAYSDGAI